MPYKPQQNGSAKRCNRTLMGMSRSMMAHSKFPLTFWRQDLSTATYLLDKVNTKVQGSYTLGILDWSQTKFIKLKDLGM